MHLLSPPHDDTFFKILTKLQLYYSCIELPSSSSIVHGFKELIYKLRDNTYTQVSPRQLLVRYSAYKY